MFSFMLKTSKRCYIPNYVLQDYCYLYLNSEELYNKCNFLDYLICNEYLSVDDNALVEMIDTEPFKEVIDNLVENYKDLKEEFITSTYDKNIAGFKEFLLTEDYYCPEFFVGREFYNNWIK